MIETDSLSKTYDDHLAVDGLTFSVAAGEVLGLVGPNGAGKTTTVRCLSGILPVTEGSAVVGGFDLSRNPVAAKRQLAFVPDEPHLFGALTVWEHLAFTSQLYDIDDFQPRARELLQRLELTDRRDSLADELSRGMRQKVAIACGLLHDPKALLLDEPMTGLDPKGIRTMIDEIKACAEGGAAVIVSSHLLGQIEGLCQRFLILRQGKLLFLGSKAEIRAQLDRDSDDATLEELFFAATEGDDGGDGESGEV